MDELIKKMVFLVGSHNFAIRESLNENETPQDGWSFHKIKDVYIAWHDANSVSCPTEKDLDDVDMLLVNAKIESDRKIQRNNKHKNDLTIKAAFRLEKQNNPNLKFSDYLDVLEAEVVS